MGGYDTHLIYLEGLKPTYNRSDIIKKAEALSLNVVFACRERAGKRLSSLKW